jgi:hypothetical protein
MIKRFFKNIFNRFSKGEKVFLGLTLFFIVGLIFLIVFPFLFELEPDKITRKRRFKDEDRPKIDTTRLAMDSCNFQSNKIKWEDFIGNSYQMDWKVCLGDFELCRENRTKMGGTLSWSGFDIDYNHIIKYDNNKLNLICKAFLKIAQDKNLSKTETAEMIVSCVQAIPYTLVLSEKKEELIATLRRTNQTNSLPYQWIMDNKPVLDEIIEYGVQSPVEFAYNLKGDCDTRTVFLYSILSKLGYDIVILNSTVEAHSILGINIATGAGNYYSQPFSNKKYYVWETTNIGFPIGSFPRFIKNNWHIALDTINP